MCKNSIEIHLLGSGYGESIILKTPIGVGIIDFYHSQTYPSKVFSWLEENDITEILFICWTHPHQDHQLGMERLLSEYSGKIKQFWLFDSNDKRFLLKYLETLPEEIKRHYKNLDNIYNEIKKLHKAGCPIKLASKGKVLYYDKDNDITITALSPTDGDKNDYNRWFEDNKTLNDLLFRDHHNQISSSLHIKFGETKIILGGDVESSSWEKILSEDSPVFHQGMASIIKVPHHGGVSGYNEAFYKRFCSPESTYLVATPFNKSSRLPNREGLKAILSKTKKLYLTLSKTSQKHTEKITFGDPDIDTKFEEKIFNNTKSCYVETFDSLEKRLESKTDHLMLEFDDNSNCIKLDWL